MPVSSKVYDVFSMRETEPEVYVETVTEVMRLWRSNCQRTVGRQEPALQILPRRLLHSARDIPGDFDYLKWIIIGQFFRMIPTA